MYVKALHGNGQTSIFEVSGEIITGHHFAMDEFPYDTAEVLGFSHSNFSLSWLSGPEPTGEYENSEGETGPCWDHRYAWWRNEDGLVTGVITSQKIYVLNDSGKTIDRV